MPNIISKCHGARVRDARGRFFYCDDCDNTGMLDIETGGGNTRRGYCSCALGELRMERSEAARDAEIDRRIHERIERRGP